MHAIFCVENLNDYDQWFIVLNCIGPARLYVSSLLNITQTELSLFVVYVYK